MGAQASAESRLRTELQEPLLGSCPGNPRQVVPLQGAAAENGHRLVQLPNGEEARIQRATSCGSCSSTSSCPPSFKAGKPRKTKDFIGSERKQQQSGQCVREVPTDIDPLLLDDSDTQPITKKVASLIFQYIEESNSTVLKQGPEEDEFHEAHFLHRRCCGCCPRRYKEPTASVDAVFSLINDVAGSLYFCKQVVVLCAIYVERLVKDETSVMLTNGNWRSVVVVALLIASKVWEDVHPWNADFEECLLEVAGMRYRRGALYHLESLFLEKLRWQVFVDGEVYAAYFFSLLEGSRPPGTKNNVRRSLRERIHTDTFMIDTIMEDEMYVFGGNEKDLERGLLPAEGASPCLMPSDGLAPSPEHSVGSIGSRSSTPPSSPTISPLPWSREELASNWRRNVLEEGTGGDAGQSGGARLRAIHYAWKLDKNNPHIGALRHAPRALAPSARIPQSANLLWAHQLASRTTDLLGPPTRGRDSSEADRGTITTLSGATGAQLASELRRYLDGRKESAEGLV